MIQQHPNMPPQPPSLREIDIGYYITHYWNLIWRWKWYILISAPLVMAGWFTYVLKFDSVKPELDASVGIGMDDPRSMSAVQNVGESVQSRIDIVRGRSFLREIVQQLSLQLTVNDLPRNVFFDSVLIDSTAAVGGYEFKIDKNQKNYQILYTNKQLGFKEKVIDQGELYKLDSLVLPGIYLNFSPSFLKMPKEFSFNIAPMRGAIERLRRSISIQGGGGGGNGGSAIAIIVKGRDYPLIAKTANIIAENFIEKTSNFKKNKTREVIEVLKRQLETATEQLNNAQNAVQNFRQLNPNVGLGDLSGTVVDIARIEADLLNAQQNAKDAEQVKMKLTREMEISEDLNMSINEAISFLTSRHNLAATSLQTEFNQLLQQQQELRTGFDKNHPYVLENKKRIASLKNRIVNQFEEYLVNLKTDISRLKSILVEKSTKITELPAQQARLAELERQAEVSEQIHSSVMARYNQAKIADATEVTDVFVMDEAIDPIPPPDVVNVLMLMGIGIMISIGVAFAPPIVFDFFDKTVRSETELTKILPTFKVLESLPFIGHRKKKDSSKQTSLKNVPISRTIDHKLVTSEFSPDFTNEIFRSLRAKIMLRFHDIPKKNILVSSFDMSEGKSLISANVAITMAQQKLRTLLIDADIRRGVQHNSFVVKKSPGLSTFLFSDDPLTPELVQSLLQPTHVQNLSLLASGQNVPNPSELLGSPRFKELITYLSTIFDVIILDTPPIGLAPDAAIISDLFTGCLLVIKAGSTNTIELKKKLEEYPNFKNKIFGLVLNQSLIDKRMRKYKYSSYYYNAEAFGLTPRPPSQKNLEKGS